MKTAHSTHPTSGRAFTIVELLVFISLVSVLVALLLPAINKAREEARRVVCGAHLKQVHLVAMLYESDYRVILPNIVGYDYGHINAGRGWRAQELLYNANLLPREHVKGYTGIPTEATLGRIRQESVLLCPSGKYNWPNVAPYSSMTADNYWWDIADYSTNWNLSDYDAPWYTGVGNPTLYCSYSTTTSFSQEIPMEAGITGGKNWMPIKQFKEEPSKKLFFIEGRQNWASVGYLDYEASPAHDGQQYANFRFPHQDLCNFLAYDGHVGFVDQNTFLKFDGLNNTAAGFLIPQVFPFVF